MIKTYNLLPKTKLYVNSFKSEFVSVTIQFRAGRLYVPSKKFEMAHLLEHVAITGSKLISTKKELTQVCESSEIYSNAFTGNQYLSYILKGKKDSLDKMLPILVSTAFEPLLRKKDLEEQKLIVRQELTNNLSDPHKLNFNNLITSLYEEEIDLSERIKSLDDISLSDITNFHKNTHVLNNCNFIICGDITHKEVDNIIQKINKLISKFEKGKSVQPIKLKAKEVKDKFLIDDKIKTKSIKTIFEAVFPIMDDNDYAQFRIRAGALLSGIGSIITLKARSRGYIYGQGGGVLRENSETIFRIITDLKSENLLPYLKLVSSEYNRILRAIDPRDIERSLGFQRMIEESQEYNMLDPIAGVGKTVEIIDKQNLQSIGDMFTKYPFTQNVVIPKPITWRLSLVGDISLDETNRKCINKLIKDMFS